MRTDKPCTSMIFTVAPGGVRHFCPKACGRIHVSRGKLRANGGFLPTGLRIWSYERVLLQNLSKEVAVEFSWIPCDQDVPEPAHASECLAYGVA